MLCHYTLMAVYLMMLVVMLRRPLMNEILHSFEAVDESYLVQLLLCHDKRCKEVWVHKASHEMGYAIALGVRFIDCLLGVSDRILFP